MSDRLCVVMPVYNERDVIASVLQKWETALSSLGLDFVIRPYNDGSRDDTLAVMNAAAERLPHVQVRDKSNGGHGHTILTGYREAASDGFNWIFQIDSDDEMGPESFSKLWSCRADFDFIVGRRHGRRQALPRKMVSFMSRLVVRLFYGKGKVWDVNAPYRLMRVSAFRDVFGLIPETTFAPNVIITGIAARLGFSACEVPVPQHDRQTGEVSIKKFRLLRAATKSLLQTVLFACRHGGSWRCLYRIIFCLVPLVGVCFSLDTNPLSAYQATDSSVFIYMGRSILDGLTPYRDVFDHKGLFLYFLNAAGLWLGDIMGLWLIECLFIFGSIAYAGVYLSRRFGFAAAWMGMLVCGAAFSFVMGGGNLTESYACGLSVFSLASLCRDVDYGGIRKRSCFVHGACAVLLLLLRPNLAVAPVVVAIAYCIGACRERSFRRLLTWSGCSLLAAFIVFAPFGLYLNAHDLWRDCFDAYIRFNLSYAGVATSRHPLLWVCAAILGAAFFGWRKARLTDRDVVGIALLFAIVAFVVLVANPLHGHYYGVFLPALVILVPFFFRNAFCGTRLRMIANGVAILAGIVELAMISAACVSGHYLADTVHGKRILNPVRYFRYDRGHMQDVDAFESIIDDRNSVTVMGNMCLIYNYLHARTPLRYPYQLPIAKLDKSIMDEVVSDLVGRKSRYIITTKQAWPEKVNKAIANNYRLVRRSGEFSLYLVDRASEVKPHRE